MLERQRVELSIEGMTCASCASRVESRLNRLDGVDASVNYATENATVTYDASRVVPEQLLEAVRCSGLPRGAAGAARR